MQELFKKIINTDVKPLLAKHDYSKKDLNFSKAAGSLVYKFNVQKSKVNTSSHVQFYINCSVHSTELAELQSVALSGVVLENKSHFTCRIEEIVPSAPAHYTLTPDINPDALSKELVSHLEEGISFLHSLTGARDIVHYYMAKTALHLSEETFRFLLQAGDTEEAKYYLQQLHAKYGAEKRWTIFEKKYAAIFAEYGM
ncbi:DUF4304 domain-containing protein [Paenibacillus sp. FSL K6-4396]|uniref:DUF4304 domain-containing protein n=1 Tax=unclassified Paenibacillus TaxID=185978 RepID=UPI00177C583F|nr:DUF4304 domain-containing protein [Paenibacillus sp. CFBP 13594]MBD8840106.1 DUF4304 domain-containing protein [Paenibacillus sp. CFBP 13594]